MLHWKRQKKLNLPNKNGTAIYYEESGALIADDKVEKCLEMGVGDGTYESDSD